MKFFFHCMMLLLMMTTIMLLLPPTVRCQHDVGTPAAVVVIQDKTTSGATVRTLDLVSNKWTRTSPLQFKFAAPLAKLTLDPVGRRAYLVSFPLPDALPTLFELDLDRGLNVSATFTAEQTFFDLQYAAHAAPALPSSPSPLPSPLPSLSPRLYGISVPSQGSLQRLFSSFRLDRKAGTVAASPLFALPSGYYVNSSDYDDQTSTYYALLNPFNASSLSPQQIMTVLLPHPNSPLSISPHYAPLSPEASSGLAFYSIAYSRPQGTLYGLAWSRPNATALVAAIDAQSGAASPLWVSNLGLGPLVPDSVQHNVYEFANNVGVAGFSVVDFDLYASPGQSGFIKTNYPGPNQVVTASFFQEITP